MALLTVPATTDFSATALLDITEIRFTNAVAATATFANTQFDNVAIRDNVLINIANGAGVAEAIVVNGGSVDASGWTFQNWTPATDTITFNGSGGGDTIEGSSRTDTINGLGGADTLIAGGTSNQNDIINGGLANDTIQYRAIVLITISDTINGGGGLADTIELLDEAIYTFSFAGISGIEVLDFGGVDQTVQFNNTQIGAASGLVAVNATAAANTLEVYGNGIDISAVNFAGWDAAQDSILLSGTDLNDGIVGSAENETFHGRLGQDFMDGGAGNDVFLYYSNDEAAAGETVDGGAGTADRLQTRGGGIVNLRSVDIGNVERLFIEDNSTSAILDGDDFGAGAITTVERNGTDNVGLTVNGPVVDLSGVSFVNWGLSVTLIVGTTGDDTLTGSSAADSISYGGGADTMSGGGGADEFIIDITAIDANLSIDGGGGADAIVIPTATVGAVDFSQVAIQEVEALRMLGATGRTAIFDGAQIGAGTVLTQISSSTGADVLQVNGVAVDLSTLVFTNWTAGSDTIAIAGTGGADTLVGSSQVDALEGLGGDDRLDGGLGADIMTGGANNDIYVVDNAGDVVTETFNQGTDTVETALASYSLYAVADVERIVYTGTGNFVGRGNGLDNRIQGASGNDRFVTDQGGADRYFGDLGVTDQMDFRLSTTGAIVNLTSGVHGGAAAGDFFSSIEYLYGSDIAGDDLTGAAFNDHLFGYAGADTLSGLGGSDYLYGGEGDDEISGGALIDFLYGENGADDFNYTSLSDSAANSGARDRIYDFVAGVDDIDVSAIDASTAGGGNEAFTQFLGSGAFTAEGQVRWFQSGANTVIEFNTTGASGAEMQIQLQNFTATNLAATDFIG